MIRWEDVEAWIRNTGAAVFDFLVKMAVCILVFLVIRRVTRRLCRWLRKKMDQFHVEASLNSFVISILYYGVLILTVVTMIVQLGIVSEASIAAAIASAGVAISLALKGGLSNFAGGILILFLKPFKAGDYILVPEENVEGTVRKIEMYYTTITTVDNQVVKIPNSLLTDNTITNVTSMDKRKLEIKVGVSYDTDLKKAKEILRQLLEEDPRAEEQDRQVFVDSLGDSSIVIGFRAWVRTEDYWAAKWDMNEKTKERFDREGIEIPYNQLDVRIREKTQ